MVPGEFRITHISKAILSRRDGWLLKDTILILSESRIALGVLIRRPGMQWGQPMTALNIDACRIPVAPGTKLGGGQCKEATLASDVGDAFVRPWRKDPEKRKAMAERSFLNAQRAQKLGRWPNNVLLQHLCKDGECSDLCPVKILTNTRDPASGKQAIRFYATFRVFISWLRKLYAWPS